MYSVLYAHKFISSTYYTLSRPSGAEISGLLSLRLVLT